MDDVAPELLEQIQKAFEENLENGAAQRWLTRIENGGGYADAGEYAEAVGQALADAFRTCLSEEVLPDGRMYWNIADRVVRPMLERDHALVADVAQRTQTALNEAAGIGIRAQTVPLDDLRIDGILNRLSEAPRYSDIAWILDAPVRQFLHSIVDESVKRNAEFQYDAGLSPIIIRRAESKCCKWCSALAGKYAYPNDIPDDVYRRHDNCRCVVEYDPGDGKRQNVHTKQWTDSAQIEERKNADGVDTAQRVRNAPRQKIEPQNVTAEYLRNARPGQGTISIPPEYDRKKYAAEIQGAQRIHDIFGGNVELLLDRKIEKQKSPDYLWNGKLWDLKTLTRESAANSAVRHGLQQIRDNQGGLILDFGTQSFSNDLLLTVLEKRMQWYHLEQDVDIIVLYRDALYEVLRYLKR